MNLLLECARPNPDDALILQAAARTSDWDTAVSQADHHGLAPLLYWHLTRVGRETPPVDALDRLRRLFRASAARSLQLTGALLEVLSIFDRADIDVLPFKGPMLAWSLYETPALREMNDLDLLVRPADRTRAIALLQSVGYEPSTSCDLRHFDPARELSLQSAAGVTVDLHWSLAMPQFDHALDAEGSWTRSTTVLLANRDVRTLGPEDRLIYLCVHGAKHGWSCLHWLSDVARLIARTQIDWDCLITAARARHTSRAVIAGILLAADLLNAPVPDHVLAEAHDNAGAVRIASRVRSRLLSGQRVQRFQFSLLERNRDKLRACWWQLQPHVSDHDSLPLPPSLFPLYYALRPLRLAAKHSAGLLRGDATSQPSS